jgi:hypothetical protein
MAGLVPATHKRRGSELFWTALIVGPRDKPGDDGRWELA